jgi:LytS/YehU family sensor histidine kinase
MRSRATAEDAIAVTTEGLARGLSANSVRFLPPAARPAPDAAALASVALGERRFGTLVLGPRVHRWPYQSEDLDFTSTVARFLAEALDSIEKRCERDATARRELELRELAARAEARALRARIDPHFLFNALNTLADLIRDDPAAAERAVLDLSGVFRFALDASGRESVPVADEVEFLRAYLDIERLRFEGRLRYEIDFPDALNDRVIPPMLIQPLVENAVRHGLAPRPEGGTVRVSVRENDGRLTVRVEDDGVGFDVGGTAAQQGVGLANVRDRVTRFFGPEAWHLESRPGRGTLVELNLPAAHATGTAQPQEGA